ncbi:hypothetical protein LI014_10110 [Clostridium perfringens]|uniref:hypothetical protein n=1 Tax=Clostridium perfringens TaxID=1502 RepID=UPI0022483947|nr:hypothetical protein [Clostridium perfringens]MCX0397737.1 hypothetical protein [Clostridium perfringens]
MNEQIKEMIKEIVIKIGERERWNEILDGIFKINFEYDKDKFIYNSSIALERNFHINANLLIEYMGDDFYLTAFDLGFEKSDVLDVINKNKEIYGTIIMQSLNKVRNPIGLQGVNVNMGSKLTHNGLTIYRNDGQELELLCTTQDIATFALTITGALLNGLNFNIYNLDRTTLENLIQVNNDVNNKIIELLGGSNER